MSAQWSGQFDRPRVGWDHPQEDWRDDDDLAPVRGIVFGIVLAVGFWVVVGLLIVGLLTGKI